MLEFLPVRGLHIRMKKSIALRWKTCIPYSIVSCIVWQFLLDRINPLKHFWCICACFNFGRLLLAWAGLAVPVHGACMLLWHAHGKESLRCRSFQRPQLTTTTKPDSSVRFCIRGEAPANAKPEKKANREVRHRCKGFWSCEHFEHAVSELWRLEALYKSAWDVPALPVYQSVAFVFNSCMPGFSFYWTHQGWEASRCICCSDSAA